MLLYCSSVLLLSVMIFFTPINTFITGNDAIITCDNVFTCVNFVSFLHEVEVHLDT